MKPVVTPSAWNELRAASPARLSLGRVGDGMPTDEVLRLGWAHAAARDAIHTALNIGALNELLCEQGWRVEQVRSRATDRTIYLRRPDLGRQLEGEDAARIASDVAGSPSAADSTGAISSLTAADPDHRPGCDICFVVADGLSCLAVQRHAAPLLAAVKPLLPASTTFAPVVIATQARVAIGDEIGEAVGARLVVVLIGERPGLSSPDSLGIYLTYGPRKGRNDSQRNCISNVRPQGLGYGLAAAKLAWLIQQAQWRGLSGVGLKDDGPVALVEGDTPPQIGSSPTAAA